MKTYVCKLCGEVVGTYDEYEFDEYGEQELWGHIQMDHEEEFEECQDWDTPYMLEEYYESECEEPTEEKYYLVDIIETHRKTVKVKASNIYEAESKAESAYTDSKIIIEYDDCFDDYEIYGREHNSNDEYESLGLYEEVI